MYYRKEAGKVSFRKEEEGEEEEGGGGRGGGRGAGKESFLSMYRFLNTPLLWYCSFFFFY